MSKYYLLIVFCFLSFSCKRKADSPTAGAPSGGPPKPMLVEALVASNITLEEEIRIPGTILPAEQIEVRPEISGIIARLNFSDGQLVTKDQILLNLRSDEPAARLNKLKIQEEILHLSEQRQADLLKAGAIGKSEYDNALLAYRSIQADILIAAAELRKYTVRAPFGGILGRRLVSPGDLITTGTTITTLTQTAPLKIKFSVPEKYSQRVKMKSKLNFFTEQNQKAHQATIQFIAPYVNDDNKNLEVMAVVDHANDKDLKPGAYATVMLGLAKKTKSILIPSQCIIPRIKDKQVALFNSGTVKFVSVEVGMRDSARVEILSGIRAGDTILTSGVMKLKAGMPVGISNLNPAK
ncbi:MAG: efflux RND transporter periplasmic adaptor subunit [Saprospiraceae bacterium]|nr:efflux RND transporter periplasmic adaptor subunit [Saprospiraceae bacterium]HMW38521.1 efflux RND transporter periplasmic adaptor subunit [Saprospiraceae bacterium]HMX88345.1 efflux RND transporter periplasmic adaptor subunit [Saprospiraceae bacterium]HMZ40237.1 efflux RND transporter periplasmic adaptor subunit [Saprospiraceae bacterium]HNA64391.1 efflux RND transporter periplasmic adaptor subunit [Saprospiraceae bacterium]